MDLEKNKIDASIFFKTRQSKIIKIIINSNYYYQINLNLLK